MKNIRTGHRDPVFAMGRTAFGAAALGVGIAGGVWFSLAVGQGWQTLLPAAVAFAVPVVVAIVWQARARTATRWHTALDAYATQEIARARRGKAAATPHPISGGGPREANGVSKRPASWGQPLAGPL
jgi:hypothetical protein